MRYWGGVVKFVCYKTVLLDRFVEQITFYGLSYRKMDLVTRYSALLYSNRESLSASSISITRKLKLN